MIQLERFDLHGEQRSRERGFSPEILLGGNYHQPLFLVANMPQSESSDTAQPKPFGDILTNNSLDQ